MRHVGSAAATYDIPGPRTTPSCARCWPTGGRRQVHRAIGRLPVDLVAAAVADPLTGELVNIRPNLVPGEAIYIDDDTACQAAGGSTGRLFAIPTAGTSGDLGRNQLAGFSLWQLDFAVHRQFPLHGQVRTEVPAPKPSTC